MQFLSEKFIDFYGYEINIKVMSAKDPHMMFMKSTGGSFLLDEEPAYDITAGVVIIIFSCREAEDVGDILERTRLFCELLSV